LKKHKVKSLTKKSKNVPLHYAHIETNEEPVSLKSQKLRESFMPTILITGANRGIGFALAQAYVDDGWRVLATRRSVTATLPEGVEPFILDIEDAHSIRLLKDALTEIPIDILWNNAGAYLDKNTSLAQMKDSDWVRSFEINTIAPIRVAEALAGNVALSERKVMAFTSSIMSSLTLGGKGAYAYRSSKIALNMAVRCFSQDYKTEGISCLLLHPGHVKTDMGGEDGNIDAATSAAGMKKLVENIGPAVLESYSGRFFNYDGSIISW
jgi:NAD(P)-dependent dehydrogenase (short-subunit alcohol dehydrogenase family)